MQFVIWVNWFNKFIHNIEHVLCSCSVWWLSNVCATPGSYTVFVCPEVSTGIPPYHCGCTPACIGWISYSSKWSILYTDFLCEWTVVELDVHVIVKKKRNLDHSHFFIIPQKLWYWICCSIVILHFCAQSFTNLAGHVACSEQGNCMQNFRL
jgi:hypothetical protein